jgi:hypothetical protein
MAPQAKVTCYSGAQYAERPTAFETAGEALEVVEVERRWREPAGVRFIVRASDGRRYRLSYHEETDQWSVQLQGKRRTHR